MVLEKQKIGILYICTGKYTIFWESFFKSSEDHFFQNDEIEKHYYVFTDSKDIEFSSHERVHLIYQEASQWPYSTLYRFKIFQKARDRLSEMDYLFFFNANMLFVDEVGTEILPDNGKELSFVLHPGFYGKERRVFTYDNNPKSLAYIAPSDGSNYFMGSLNGGTSEAYMALIDELERRIEIDEESEIIALWHDESHLNKYALDYPEKVKHLSPSYAFTNTYNLSMKPKIYIRDKTMYGSHDFLRNIEKS